MSGSPRQAAGTSMHHVRHSAAPQDIESFRNLARSYYDWLGEDLTYQAIEAELQGLPGCYAPPTGFMLIASAGAAATDSQGLGVDVGIVGIRPLTTHNGTCACQTALGGCHVCMRTCEMKRLYVSPSAQGAGVGRLLVRAAVSSARDLGYKYLVLDTLPRLAAANRIYEAEGFQAITPYCKSLPDAMFWGKIL